MIDAWGNCFTTVFHTSYFNYLFHNTFSHLNSINLCPLFVVIKVKKKKKSIIEFVITIEYLSV